MLFIGISRDMIFSEGRVMDDAAIFNAVASLIRDAGYDVVLIPESVLVSDGLPSDLAIDGIFHMARSSQALDIIDSYCKQGVPVINNPGAVRNCNRTVLYTILKEAGIPMPWTLVQPKDSVTEWGVFPCWIKGCKVQFASDINGLRNSLVSETDAEVLIQAHTPGIAVKFYGVGESFFCSRQITDITASRFGHEIRNDLHPKEFDQNALRNIAMSAARAVGLKVYGGDAIVTPQRELLIIDMNDWPSFRTCRNQAAAAIWAEMGF